MLSFDDPRWSEFDGGYRVRFDPRPILLKLAGGSNTGEVWHELWEELHHQGDVGLASFAAIPHIVQIYKKLGVVDWNAYAMVSIIELARGRGNNPEVPEWLAKDYFAAIRELAAFGLGQIEKTQDAETVCAILSVIALARGLKMHAKFLVSYSEDELTDMESQAGF